MAKQSPGLSNEAKLKINTELKFLEQFLTVWDFNKDRGIGKEDFLKTFGEALLSYEDMVSTGTERPRAKYILMASMRNELAKMYLSEGAKRAGLDGPQPTRIVSPDDN